MEASGSQENRGVVVGILYTSDAEESVDEAGRHDFTELNLRVVLHPERASHSPAMGRALASKAYLPGCQLPLVGYTTTG